MRKKIKLGKIATVIFLTLLIWVWADLRQDDTHSVLNASINAARNTPKYWVRFADGPSAPIKEIEFKGPAANINTLKTMESAGTFEPRFFYNPEKEGATTSGERRIDLATFIKNQEEIKDLGLSVEKCTPESVTVNIVPLIEKPCVVRCVDAQDYVLNAKIEPTTVNMYVPEDWMGVALTATVKLSQDEKTQARLAPVPNKQPFIVLPDGQRRTADEVVSVQLGPEADSRKEYRVQAVLNIAYPPSLNGKWKAEVQNLNALLQGVSVNATEAALAAYKDQPPHIILYIRDGDETKEGLTQQRSVVYNFPPQFANTGQIEVNGLPLNASFTMVPITATPQQ
jgi:hypothetical protein